MCITNFPAALFLVICNSTHMENVKVSESEASNLFSISSTSSAVPDISSISSDSIIEPHTPNYCAIDGLDSTEELCRRFRYNQVSEESTDASEFNASHVGGEDEHNICCKEDMCAGSAMIVTGVSHLVSDFGDLKKDGDEQYRYKSVFETFDER